MRARTVIQYTLGLLSMSFGVVLLKKSAVGVSALAAIPSALYNITPFSFGVTNIFFMLWCFLARVVVQRKLTAQSLLSIPVTLLYGYSMDGFMFLLRWEEIPYWLGLVVALLGVVFTALGIVTIVGSHMTLPTPDAFLRAISTRYHKPHPRVKLAGDAVFAAISVAIELVACGRVLSLGVGTIFSVLLTGRLVGVFTKHLPQLEME